MDDDQSQTPPKDRLIGQMVLAGVCLVLCLVVFAVHLTRVGGRLRW